MRDDPAAQDPHDPGAVLVPPLLVAIVLSAGAVVWVLAVVAAVVSAARPRAPRPVVRHRRAVGAVRGDERAATARWPDPSRAPLARDDRGDGRGRVRRGAV